MSKYNLISEFFSETDAMFDIYNGELDDNLRERIKNVVELDVSNFVDAICYQDDILLESKDIPIFSNFVDCTINMCLILETFNNIGIDMQKLGAILLEYDAKQMAHYKYGESHSKAAAALGLVKIKRMKSISKVYLTNMGAYYLNDKFNREKVITRLLLRSKILHAVIKKYYCCGCNDISTNISFLSHTTQVRRMSNIKTFIFELSKSNEYDFHKMLEELDYTIKEK